MIASEQNEGSIRSELEEDVMNPRLNWGDSPDKPFSTDLYKPFDYDKQIGTVMMTDQGLFWSFLFDLAGLGCTTFKTTN